MNTKYITPIALIGTGIASTVWIGKHYIQKYVINIGKEEIKKRDQNNEFNAGHANFNEEIVVGGLVIHLADQEVQKRWRNRHPYMSGLMFLGGINCIIYGTASLLNNTNKA